MSTNSKIPKDVSGKNFSSRDYIKERKAAHQKSRDYHASHTPRLAKSGEFKISEVTGPQWAWFACHAFVLIGTIVSIFFRLTLRIHTFWPRIFYRLTLLAAIGAHGSSLRHSLNGEMPTFFAMLPLETFQFLMLAGIWLISPSHITKLLPFAFNSILHTMDFHCRYISRTGVIGGKLADVVDKYSYRMTKISSFIEFYLFVILIWDLLRLKHSSLLSLLFYAFFFRIRMLYSPITQETVQDIWLFVDGELSKPSRPAKLRETWAGIKDNVVNHSSHAKAMMRKEEEKAIKEQNANAN